MRAYPLIFLKKKSVPCHNLVLHLLTSTSLSIKIFNFTRNRQEQTISRLGGETNRCTNRNKKGSTKQALVSQTLIILPCICTETHVGSLEKSISINCDMNRLERCNIFSKESVHRSTSSCKVRTSGIPTKDDFLGVDSLM